MGGGDLNLKKSWHPSTMKNMERVWKAQQQDHQEKKKIAELKRDIEMERDREDMTKYAMQQGVIEKKDDKKLDWMYKGPQQINREDYLTGKKIDKAFEQFAQAEKDVERNRAPSNHVEYECIPPSLRSFTGNDQVDLARKMLEDPLCSIKKKEMESKSKLLQNPVKLKKLRALVTESKSSPSSSKHKSSSSKSSSDRTSKDDRKSFKKKVLSDKEKLRRLKEMMDNASWREKERKKSAKRYKEQDMKDAKEQTDKKYNNDFIRKQLAQAAEVSTVASRIKSNMNNIQRSGRAMDTHFAKR